MSPSSPSSLPPPTEGQSPALISAPLSSPAANVNHKEQQKTANLRTKISKLEQQIQETERKQKEIDGKLMTSDPHAIVKEHIRLLHDYNEIRDVGQGLMGMIADNRGVRAIDVYKDFDVDEGD